VRSDANEYHPAFEEYSETIFELTEDGTEVIQARIAERLQVSRPAVSEMVQRMEREDLVAIDDRGHISLTDDGLTLATTVVRRHRLAECVLTDVLGLGWTDAHREAGKWEHIISPVVEEAMVRLLDNPTTCPHGNPIPGSGYAPPNDAGPLADLDAGSTFRVLRIPEELEFEPGLLGFLETSGILPGRVGTIVAVSPDGATTVAMDEGVVGLGLVAAERILVAELDVPDGAVAGEG
jgi:DtxR family Mn-dependent transcriptional regulator